MAKRIFSFLACCLIFVFSAQAEEVLMVRWYQGAMADALFEEKLRQLHPTVNFTYLDANRDRNTLVRLVKDYDFSKVDLVYSFGTTATKIVKGYLNGRKPLVFNVVSTPVLSRIAHSMEKPGNNLTGARMLVDLEEQIDVLVSVRPVKVLGVWFDPREKQSKAVLFHLQKIASEKGIEVKPVRIIPDAKKFEKILKKAVDETEGVDAVYLISSGSFVMKYQKIQDSLPASLVTMGIVKGVTLAVGMEPETLSNMAAERAHKILNGERAGDIPIGRITRKNAILYVRPSRAKAARLEGLDKLGMKVKWLETWQGR